MTEIVTDMLQQQPRANSNVQDPLAPSRRLSIAPMLDWTDRHCRYFHRQLSQYALLYTEMVTTGAILYGKGDYLQFNDAEHPVALQLGGSDPQALAQCAKIAEQRGYDEVNLNVGCPSDRVQNGRFGACLMAEPTLVADCVKAMRDVVSIPVTVKHRIGIDEQDSYSFMSDFVGTVAAAGCNVFIVHARKAWLQGLSPKENREVPPLDYERVYQLKRDFPALSISINGGITDLTQVQQHLDHVDGVMMGRAAYQNPYLLAAADQLIFGADAPTISRQQVVANMMDYIEQVRPQGTWVANVSRHMMGLFQGLPGARAWRRHLSEQGRGADKTAKVLAEAMSHIRDL